MDESTAPEGGSPEESNPQGGSPPASGEERIRQLEAELAAAIEANKDLQARMETLQTAQAAAPASPEPPPGPAPNALPLPTPPSAPRAAAPAAPAKKLSGVLLVDDSKIMRMSLSRLVHSFGYRVVGEADSGEFGADMAVSLQPAVVILDHTMPGMSGLECAAIIRERSPETRIVVLTSTMDQSTGVNYASMGVTDILAKPAQTELLRKVLMKLLGPPPSAAG